MTDRPTDRLAHWEVVLLPMKDESSSNAVKYIIPYFINPNWTSKSVMNSNEWIESFPVGYLQFEIRNDDYYSRFIKSLIFRISNIRGKSNFRTIGDYSNSQ